MLKQKSAQKGAVKRGTPQGSEQIGAFHGPSSLSLEGPSLSVRIPVQKSGVAKKLPQKIHLPLDWRTFGPAPVIGVDEVGRGCLAGPVYAAAVSFNSDFLCELVTDSKLLSESRREELSIEILKHHQVGIGFASVQEIDEINILQASLLAMRRAVRQLGASSGHLLIDGNMKIPRMSKAFTQTPVVKGDLRVALISAASIVAKVTRDQWMKDLARKYPQYGFDLHKGYGTSFHQESIAKHGPCKLHRRTFAGVREYFATKAEL